MTRHKLTKAELIAFETDIAAEFNAGKIRAPIHLSGGNEDALIEIFKNVESQDWVCTNWRSHYHCLLHGVPPSEVKAAIMAGKSITLCFPEYRIISSAIVGGIIPIALGLAWAAKHRGLDERVYCFVGDMTSMTGTFAECGTYAKAHKLPLRLVIEANDLSVCTPTKEVWPLEHIGVKPPGVNQSTDGIMYVYWYHLPWPHSGAGKRVEF